MNKKPVHFLEIVWIIVAIGCFVLGIAKALSNNINNSLMFFLFAAISTAMYALRRHIRKNASD
jgi:uncharacterized membrane protein